MGPNFSKETPNISKEIPSVSKEIPKIFVGGSQQNRWVVGGFALLAMTAAINPPKHVLA